MNKTKLKTSLFIVSSFLIPAIMMFFIYLSQGIYWNSDTSPLLGDGYHQYVIFDTTLRNILHGTDSLFYSFQSGLGINFYALSSYYLGSFFSPLVYFFNAQSMPDAVYLITLLKFGAIGLSTYISLHGMFSKIPRSLVLTLSTSFALMSFAISQIEIKTWLDVFILAPLILYGFKKLIYNEGEILYFISLTSLFIQNYYFGFMMSIFLILWYLTQLSWDIKVIGKRFFHFVIVSLLSVITSLVMLYPTFLDLRTHGESFSKVDSIFTEKSWYLDVFAKNFIGSFDTTKYGSIPMIYVGLFPLLLAITFFFVKSIKFHVKLSYFILLTILILSFRFQLLDLLWQGMHAPNMFLHRYSWIFSLTIILMAGEVLNRIEEITWIRFSLANFLLILGFGATVLYSSHYKFLDAVNFIVTFEFLIAFYLVCLGFILKKIPPRLFYLSILFFSIFELSVNSYYQMEGIANEWVFASRSSYERDLKAIQSLIREKTDSNYRTEILQPQTGNDSMKYGYNGISQFSSVRNTDASSTLDKLGFKSEGTNLNLRYQNNSILMDSLFGVRYNLSQQPVQKFGFKEIAIKNGVSLSENEYALPIAFLSAKPYKNTSFTNLTLDNQTRFIHQITDEKYKFYKKLNILSPTSQNTTSSLQTAKIEEDSHLSYASIQYEVMVPAHSQLYVNVPNLQFSNDDRKEIEISYNGQNQRYTIDNAFPFFSIGHFDTEETVTIRMSFPENSTVSFDTPEFFALDLDQYTQAIASIRQQEVAIHKKKNKLVAAYNATRDTTLIFTLPYDKGWSAKQNGKPIQIHRIQKGLMGVRVSKGSGTVTLTFVPQGFIEGLIAFFVGIILFFLYEWRQIKRRKS